MLYVLQSPGGYLVEKTVSTSRSETWPEAILFICDIDENFRSKYFQRTLDASRKAAKRRGWKVIQATLIVNKRNSK